MPFRLESLGELEEGTGLKKVQLARELEWSKFHYFQIRGGDVEPTVSDLDTLKTVAQKYGLDTKFYEEPNINSFDFGADVMAEAESLVRSDVSDREPMLV